MYLPPGDLTGLSAMLHVPRCHQIVLRPAGPHWQTNRFHISAKGAMLRNLPDHSSQIQISKRISAVDAAEVPSEDPTQLVLGVGSVHARCRNSLPIAGSLLP